MRLLMLACLLPAAMAAFDKCARPTGEWVGFDQGHGTSKGRALTYSAGNLYVGGESKGSLSFGSKHMDGTYSDHEGTSTTHDTHIDVTIHHETGSFAGTGSSNQDAAGSQLGQDATVYKISEAGVPLKVFGADTLGSDGSTDGTGENGKYGGWSYFDGLDAFDGEPDVVAGVGMYRGALKFPMADNTDKTLLNRKYMSKDGFVAKIDMTTGKAVWATDDGMKIDNGVSGKDTKQIYGRGVATTGLGHVVAVSDIRSPYIGLITKHNGADGTHLWATQFPEIYNMWITSAGDEMAYVTGAFEGTNPSEAWMATGVCDGGAEKSAFIAAFDVSPDTGGPVAKWMTQVGCGSGGSVRVEGNFLYVAGQLTDAATIGTCAPLTGTQGGYLAKLNKDDGTCVWAKDAPRISRAITDGTHVWTFYSTRGKITFDDDHILYGDANNDMFIAKYDASDGTGLWAESFGGTGSDSAYDAAMTATGPVFLGYSNSDAVTAGDLAVTNLQKQRVEADPSLSLKSGFTLLKLASVEREPPCVTNCPSGELTDATIAANNCYIEGKCIAHDAPFPRLPCFKCDANTDPRNLPENANDITNYCYFDDTCVEAGNGAPYYTKYNSASVCEVCQPAVDTTGYTLAPNYFHDRAYAKAECWAATMGKGAHNMEPGPCAPNNFGILFTRNSGGCQELPDVPLPATPSAALAMALEVPTSGAVADVGARAIKAITETNTATTVDGSQLVSAWYHANLANCNGASGFEVDHDKDPSTPKHKTGACKNTPAAHADEMASLFDTSMYYGHSVARIKVQQALAILDNDFKTGTVTAVKDDMKKDIVAHILVPMYQGAIKAAYDMDTASDKAAALAAGLAYWNLIHPNVPGFDAADKARLVALFGSSAASGTHNYCEVKAILHRNLPDGSMLQYGQQTHQTIGVGKGSQDRPLRHASGLPTASLMHVPEVSGKDGNQPKPISGELGIRSETEATEGVHIKERDIGTLVAAVDGGGESIVCTYPPPAPPPPPPPSPSSPSKSDSDSGLTDGEIAGVAIGAAIGGIVLLGAVGLILRSIMFKEAKPVFTCLEKAPAKSPA